MTADTVGGVWTYSIELIRALGEHGVEVALATMGALPTAEQREQAEQIPNVRLYSSSYKLEWMEDPWEDVRRAGEWLLRIEERFKPDLVHLNGYAHGALPWRAPVLIVGHSCVLSWWSAVKKEPAPASWDRYSHEVSRGLASAAQVLAPSGDMLANLLQHYGPFADSRVVYNGRDAELFPPSRKDHFVFSSGRIWDEAKNIAALEQAAPRISWPVYLAGEEEHPGGGRADHKNVRALGRLAPQAVLFWLARAAIYALPARYEPFGLSILEAALAECALVLGDIPSLREIWGDTAIFVAPDDIDALTRNINLLTEDETYRRILAARARKRALEYSPRRMARGYLTAYQDLLKLRPLPATFGTGSVSFASPEEAV